MLYRKRDGSVGAGKDCSCKQGAFLSEGLTKHGYHSLQEFWKRALQIPWERAFRVNTSALFRKISETSGGTGTERGEGTSSEKQGMAATDHKDLSQQLQLWISLWRGGRQWKGDRKPNRYVGFLFCFLFETESHHRVLLCSTAVLELPQAGLKLSEIWLPLPLLSCVGIKGMYQHTRQKHSYIF